MKKLLTIFILLAVVFSMTACDDTRDDSDPADTTPAATTPAETTPAETTPDETTPAETTPAETTPAETTPAETTSGAAGEPTVVSKLEGAKASELYATFCEAESKLNYLMHSEIKVSMSTGGTVISETTTTTDALVNGHNYYIESDELEMVLIDNVLYLKVLDKRVKITLSGSEAEDVLGKTGVTMPTPPSEISGVIGEKLSDGTTRLTVTLTDEMLNALKLSFGGQFGASGTTTAVNKFNCSLEIIVDADGRMASMVTTTTGEFDMGGILMTLDTVATSTLDYSTTLTVTVPDDAASYAETPFKDLFGD